VILSQDILFIHIPKTAGVSCTDFLCEHLRGPIAYFALRPGSSETEYNNAQIYPGFNHETLEEIYADSERIRNLTGISIDQVGRILAVIRHPYDLEVSTYLFFKNGHRNFLQLFKNSPNIIERIAMAQGPFKNFVAKSGYFRKESEHSIGGRPYRTEDYLLLDGQLPESLHILRFEEIQHSLPAAVKAYTTSSVSAVVPHLNRSQGKRGTLSVDVDDETKELIVAKHRWVFEQGYYQP
jgi:hypothetical protein